MTSIVIVKRHDGTEARHNAVAFSATEVVYLIEDTDGMTWFEPKRDVKEVTTESIQDVEELLTLI